MYFNLHLTVANLPTLKAAPLTIHNQKDARPTSFLVNASQQVSLYSQKLQLSLSPQWIGFQEMCTLGKGLGHSNGYYVSGP